MSESYHTEFEVLVQVGVGESGRHNHSVCKDVTNLDEYTELVSQNGDLYVYRCTDISVAEDLIAYLDGMLIRPFVVGNPRIAMVRS